MPGECGREYISDELQSSHIGPERLEWLKVGCCKSLYKLSMAPEDGRFARTGDEWKRPIRMVVDRRIELANDVTEHAPRGDEKSPAISAVGRVADAVG